MELTKQVPSLELCKRLKELGWNYDTFWAWEYTGEWENPSLTYYTMKAQIPAPTVAELGEALPTHFKEYFMVIMKINTKNIHNWQIGYQRKEFPTMLHAVEAETEADARAKMWIYLKENNLI